MSQGGNDGLELFNCQDGSGNSKSAIGYYKSVTHPAGSIPDALIDVSSKGFISWEGQTLKATFPDGDVFTWTINADAQKQAVQDVCGVASNNYRSFTMRKSDDLVKFLQNGFEYVSIYWCD